MFLTVCPETLSNFWNLGGGRRQIWEVREARRRRRRSGWRRYRSNSSEAALLACVVCFLNIQKCTACFRRISAIERRESSVSYSQKTQMRMWMTELLFKRNSLERWAVKYLDHGFCFWQLIALNVSHELFPKKCVYLDAFHHQIFFYSEGCFRKVSLFEGRGRRRPIKFSRGTQRCRVRERALFWFGTKR